MVRRARERPGARKSPNSLESAPQSNLSVPPPVDQDVRATPEGDEGEVAGAASVRSTTVAAQESGDFVALVQAELPGSYRLAGYLLADACEAEDAICEAVARAWKARSQLREPDHFAAWFGRIVGNVCRDRIRRRRGIRTLDIDDPNADAAGDRDEFREALARDEIGRLVRRLPPDQQLIVALRFWRDLSLGEIVDRLDLPLGTVKSRLHYAVRSLRKELDREGKVSR
jgi:RNA polymerase sigma-70 factor (ECF subfamily)